MARRSQYWVMLLVVFFVAAATAAVVSAEKAAPTIAEQAEGKANMAAETVKNEAPKKVDDVKEETKKQADETKKQADQTGDTVKAWTDWAMKSTFLKYTPLKSLQVLYNWVNNSRTGREWSGKGYEAAKVYGSQAQEHGTGMYAKWSKWAQDTVGQYAGGKKNPAAEAAAYIEKKRTGSTDEEL